MTLYQLAKERIARRSVEETIRLLKAKERSDAEIHKELQLRYGFTEFQANQALREAKA